MKTEEFKDGIFTTLLNFAQISAILRVMTAIGLQPKLSFCLDPIRYESKWFILNDSTRESMARFGKYCKELNHDIRSSAFWPLLESQFQSAWKENFETGRRVEVHEITPKILLDKVGVGNHLSWNGWIIKEGEAEEKDDDYGQPIWAADVIVQTPAGKIELFSPISRSVACELYFRITGLPVSVTDRELNKLFF